MSSFGRCHALSDMPVETSVKRIRLHVTIAFTCQWSAPRPNLVANLSLVESCSICRILLSPSSSLLMRNIDNCLVLQSIEPINARYVLAQMAATTPGARVPLRSFQSSHLSRSFRLNGRGATSGYHHHAARSSLSRASSNNSFLVLSSSRLQRFTIWSAHSRRPWLFTG
jgi:hypothetical protein